jgi:hypothetical protein
MKNLLVLCKKWQRTLRLEEWDISFFILDDKEMNAEEVNNDMDANETNGFIVSYFINRCAKIYIRKNGPDVQRTIVHELTHLHLCEINELANEMIKHISSKDLQAQFEVMREAYNERAVYSLSRLFDK